MDDFRWFMVTALSSLQFIDTFRDGKVVWLVKYVLQLSQRVLFWWSQPVLENSKITIHSLTLCLSSTAVK